MTLNLSIPTILENVQPKISVIGVGGAGCNAVNTMINSNVLNVDFMVANTDGQALTRSLTQKQIQLGKNLTSGLGAGSDHQIGEKAALESLDEIISEIGDINMLFIATGMGGGTGTGASPIIAQAAKEKGILTIAVATKPFDFEGKKRMDTAEEGLKKLNQSVDTMIVIPNQNLFRIANEKTTFAEAFKLADDVLYEGISGITDLITSPGMINLDFSDIKTVMKNMGKAMIGTGESSGENRAQKAAETALNNPLLDNTSINGATSILLNIKGGADMGLLEVDEAASLIREQVDVNANIIFGTSIDKELDGIIKVSIVATGIDGSKFNTSSLDEKPVHKNSEIKLEKELGLNNSNFEEQINKETNIENSEQIDIETKIANLDNVNNDDSKNEKNPDTNNELTDIKSYDILEDKKKELSELINNNKIENEEVVNKDSTFLKKISSLFHNQKSNETSKENKIDPSIYSLNSEQINVTKENEMNKENTPLLKLTNVHTEDNLDKESQIELLDINQEEEDKLDENVLEIPAFLRRQAN